MNLCYLTKQNPARLRNPEKAKSIKQERDSTYSPTSEMHSFKHSTSSELKLRDGLAKNNRTKMILDTDERAVGINTSVGITNERKHLGTFSSSCFLTKTSRI